MGYALLNHCAQYRASQAAWRLMCASFGVRPPTERDIVDSDASYSNSESDNDSDGLGDAAAASPSSTPRTTATRLTAFK